MTIILRIKFSGAPKMKWLMDYAKKNLKCRIHDEEFNLLDTDDKECMDCKC